MNDNINGWRAYAIDKENKTVLACKEDADGTSTAKSFPADGPWAGVYQEFLDKEPKGDS